MVHTLLHVEDQLEHGIGEEGLDHHVVDAAEDGLYDAAHHAHAHLVLLQPEALEDGGQGSRELGVVEEVVLNQVLGYFGLLEDVGEIVVSGKIEGFCAFDFQVVLAYFLTNQSPKYNGRCIPHSVALSVLFKGDGQIVVSFLEGVGPSDD